MNMKRKNSLTIFSISLALVAMPLLLAGCATEPDEAAGAKVAEKKTEPVPEPTAETRTVQDLVQKWRNMGLNAFGQYQSSSTTIQWALFRTTLPAEIAAAEAVVQDAARFAKQAGRPVQLLMSTKNSKDDARLSQAIKVAVQKSGGSNNIKFDHLIDARVQPMVEIKLQGGK